MRALGLVLLASVLVIGCAEEPVRPIGSPKFVSYTDEEYDVITSVLNLPNRVDDYEGGEGFVASSYMGTLGRVLFYDKQLSKDNSVSCASCHDQQHAFADPVDFSTGIYGRTTARNSIALGSFAAFNDEYGGGSSGALGAPLPGKPLFWDMRATSIHSQMEETIANENEMGMSLNEVSDRLKGQEHYEILFRKAFETETITAGRILDALETFMLSIKAENTKIEMSLTDHNVVSIAFLMQHDLTYLNKEENHGLRLFISKCASCHQSSLGPKVDPLSNLHQLFFANNGLDMDYADKGRGDVTGISSDNGVFKIPSLRNITLTYPYMHDGRFNTLEEVIDFYSEGIQPHENLDHRLRNPDGSPKQFELDEEEKAALIAFLGTLTSMQQMSHLKFSDPWK
jgi:cytochrome c peroxidase